MMRRNVAWTDNELHKMRQKLVSQYYRDNRESPKEITCDKCPWVSKATCPCVYDIYNTDGDCLFASGGTY